MRDFTIQPGGNTPFHCHPHEHIVKFVRGKGVVVNEKGEETVVSEGQNLFVPGNSKHQFRNPFEKPFGFLCIILNPDKN
jgi:quercetin dioxygenase-like cupin family protein